MKPVERARRAFVSPWNSGARQQVTSGAVASTGRVPAPLARDRTISGAAMVHLDRSIALITAKEE